jgi:hypothetical protein
MTLGDFIRLIGENPRYVLLFFGSIPLIALLANFMGRNEGNETPWKYLYSTLLYAVCVPGIFSVALSIYIFLFQKGDIFNTDIYTQIMPIVSMIATILVVRQNADLNQIPGFDRLSGLVMIIAATMVFMWFLTYTRIMVFSYMPFSTVLIIFAVLLVAIRIGWAKFISK